MSVHVEYRLLLIVVGVNSDVLVVYVISSPESPDLFPLSGRVWKQMRVTNTGESLQKNITGLKTRFEIGFYNKLYFDTSG